MCLFIIFLLGKKSGTDREIYKQLKISSPPMTSTSKDPDQLSGSDSGELTTTTTLGHFISILNSVFDEYDFSDVKMEHFIAPGLDQIRAQLGQHLDPAAVGQVWEAIDKEIQLGESEAYSYDPPLDSDPFVDDGSIWSFFYFFYNKSLKRIIFLSLQSFRNKQREFGTEEMDDDDIIM